jgi:Arc/MetJ-type ribon-helix-helix transcriptional regulator
MFYGSDTMAQQKKELVNLNIRIPITLKELIGRYIECDCHTNISDFARDALREKLAKDAPELFRQLFTQYKHESEKKPEAT